MDRHDYYSGNSNTHLPHHQQHTNSQQHHQQHHNLQQQHLQQQPQQQQQQQQQQQHSHQHHNNTGESQLNASVKPLPTVQHLQQLQQLQPPQPHHVHHTDLQHPLQSHQPASSTQHHHQQQHHHHLHHQHQQSQYALPHLSAQDASATTSNPSNTVANGSSVITAQPNHAYDVFDGFNTQHQHQHQHQQQQQPIEPARPGSESNTPMDYSDTAVASVASVASVTSVASTDLATASKATPPAQQQQPTVPPAYTLSYPAAIESPTVAAGAGIDAAKLTPAPIASASSTTSSLSAVALSPAVGATPLGSEHPNAYVANAVAQLHQLQPQAHPLAQQQHQSYNQHLPAYEHAQYHAKAADATAAFPADAAKQQVYPAFRAQNFAPAQQQQLQHQYQTQQSLHQQQQLQQLQHQQQQQKLHKNQMISPGDSAKAQSKLLPAFASFGGGNGSSTAGSATGTSSGRHMPPRGYADELIITSQQTGRAYLYQQQHQHQLHQQQQQQLQSQQAALHHQQHQQQSRSQHKSQTLHQPQAVHSDPSSRNPNSSAFNAMQQSAFYTPQSDVPPYTISVQHAQHQQHPNHQHSQQQPQHPLAQLQHTQKQQQQYQQYASHSANRHAYVGGNPQQQHNLSQHPQHPQSYTHAQRLYAAQQQQQQHQQQQGYQSHSAHRARGAAHPYKMASTQPHESVETDPLSALAGNIRGYQQRPTGYGNYYEGQQQQQHQQQQSFPHVALQQQQPLQQSQPQHDYGPSGTAAASASHLQTHYPTKSSNVIFAPCTTTATQPTNTATFGTQQPHVINPQQQQPVANIHLQPRQPTIAQAAAAAYQQQQHQLQPQVHHPHQQPYHPAAADQHYHQLQPLHHQTQQRISAKAYSSQHLQHSQTHPHHPHHIQQQAEKVYSLHPTAIVGVGTHLHHHNQQQQPTHHPHQSATQHHPAQQPHMMYPTAMNGHAMERYSSQQNHAQLQLQYQQQQMQRQQQQHLQQHQHQHQLHQTYEKRMRVTGPTEIIDLEEQIDYSKIIKPRSAEYPVEHHLMGKQMTYESHHLQQQQQHQHQQQHQQQHMPQPSPLNGYGRYEAYDAASPYQQRTCDPTVGGGGGGGLRDYLSTWNEFADDDEEEGAVGMAPVTLEPTSDNEKAIAQQMDVQMLAKSADTGTLAAVDANTSDKEAAGNLPDILADIEKQKETTASATGPLIVYERIPVDLADLEKYKHLSILNKLPDYVVQLPSLPTLVDDPQMPIAESASAKVVEESLRIIEDVASTRAKEKSDFERNVQYDEDFINSVDAKGGVAELPELTPVSEVVTQPDVQTEEITNNVAVAETPVETPVDNVVEEAEKTVEHPIDLAVGNTDRPVVDDNSNAISELVAVQPTPAATSCAEVEVAKKLRKRLHKKNSHQQQRRNSTSSSSPPTQSRGNRRSAVTMITTTVDDIIDYKCFGSAGATVTESEDDCEAGHSSELLSSSPTTPTDQNTQNAEGVHDQPDCQLQLNGNLFRPASKHEAITNSTPDNEEKEEREPRLRSKKYRNRRKEAAQRQREEEAEDRTHFLQIATLQRLCVDAFNTKEFRRFMKSSDVKNDVDMHETPKPVLKDETPAANDVHPLCASLAPVAASNSNDVMFRVSPMRFMGLDVDAAVLPDLTALMTENCEQFNVDSGDDYDALDCLTNGTNGLSTATNHLEVKFAQYNDTLREMESIKRMEPPRAVRHNSFGSDFFDNSSLAFVMGASGQMHSSDSLFPDPPNRIVETPPPCNNNSAEDEHLREQVDEEMPNNSIGDDRMDEGPITNANLFLTNGLAEEDSRKDSTLETVNIDDLSKATTAADLSSADLETTSQSGDFPYDLSLSKNLETDMAECFKHTPQTSTPIGEIDFDGMQMQEEIELSQTTELDSSENRELSPATESNKNVVHDDQQRSNDECADNVSSTDKSAVISSNQSSSHQDDSASSSSSDNSSSSSSESDSESSDDETSSAVKPPVLNTECKMSQRSTTSDQTRSTSAHQMSDYQRSPLSESDDSDEEETIKSEVTSNRGTNAKENGEKIDEVIKCADEENETRSDVNTSNISTDYNAESDVAHPSSPSPAGRNICTPQSTNSQRSSLSESDEDNQGEPQNSPTANTSAASPRPSPSSGLSESVCSGVGNSFTSGQTPTANTSATSPRPSPSSGLSESFTSGQTSVDDLKSTSSESESDGDKFVNKNSTPLQSEKKPTSPLSSRHSTSSSSSSNCDSNSDDSDEDFDSHSVPQPETHMPDTVRMNEELQLSSSDSEDECFGSPELKPSSNTSQHEEFSPDEETNKSEMAPAEQDREAETHEEIEQKWNLNTGISNADSNESNCAEETTDRTVDAKLSEESRYNSASEDTCTESQPSVEESTSNEHIEDTGIPPAEKDQEEQCNIPIIEENHDVIIGINIADISIEDNESFAEMNEVVGTEEQQNEAQEDNSIFDENCIPVDKLENEIEQVESVLLDKNQCNDMRNETCADNSLYEGNGIAEDKQDEAISDVQWSVLDDHHLSNELQHETILCETVVIADDQLANTIQEAKSIILENHHNTFLQTETPEIQSNQSYFVAGDCNMSEVKIDDTKHSSQEIFEEILDNSPAVEDSTISSQTTDEEMSTPTINCSNKPSAVVPEEENIHQSTVVQSHTFNFHTTQEESLNVPTPIVAMTAEHAEDEKMKTTNDANLELEDGEIFEEDDVEIDTDSGSVCPLLIAPSASCDEKHSEGITVSDMSFAEDKSIEQQTITPVTNKNEDLKLEITAEVVVAVNGIEKVSPKDEQSSKITSDEKQLQPVNEQKEMNIALDTGRKSNIADDNSAFVSDTSIYQLTNKIKSTLQKPLQDNFAMADSNIVKHPLNTRGQDDKSLNSMDKQTTSILEDLIDVTIEPTSVAEKSVITIETDKFASVQDIREESTTALETIGLKDTNENVMHFNILGSEDTIAFADDKNDVSFEPTTTDTSDVTTRNKSPTIELHDEESLDPTAMLEAAFDDAFSLKPKTFDIPIIAVNSEAAQTSAVSEPEFHSTPIEQYCPLKSELFLIKMRQKRQSTQVDSNTKLDHIFETKHQRLSSSNSVEMNAQIPDITEPKTATIEKSPKRESIHKKKHSKKTGYESDCSISSSTSSSSSSSSSSTTSTSSSSSSSTSSSSSDSDDNDAPTTDPAVLIDDLFSLESEVAPIESHLSHIIAYDTTDNLDIFSQSDLDARIDPYRNLDNPYVVLAPDSIASDRIPTPDLPPVAMPGIKKTSRLDPRLDPTRLANDMLALGDCSLYVRQIQTGVEELMSNIVRANRWRNESSAEPSQSPEPIAQRPAISRPIIDLSDLLLERQISEEVQSILDGTDEEDQHEAETTTVRADSAHRMVELDVAKLMGELSAGVDLSKAATRPSTPQSINDLLDDLMTHAPVAVEEAHRLPTVSGDRKPDPEAVQPAASRPVAAPVLQLDTPILPPLPPLFASAKRAECTETYFELFDEQHQQQLILDISADLATYEEVVSDTASQLTVARDLSAMRRRLHAKHRNAALASQRRGHLQLLRKYVRIRVARRNRSVWRTKLAQLLAAKAPPAVAAVAAKSQVEARPAITLQPIVVEQPPPPQPKKKRSSKSESCSTPASSLPNPVPAKRSCSASSPPSSVPKSPAKLSKTAADLPPKAQTATKVPSTSAKLVERPTRGLVAKRRSTYVDPPAPVGPSLGKKTKPNFEQMLLGIDQFYTKAKTASSPSATVASAAAAGSLNNNSSKVSNANASAAADSSGGSGAKPATSPPAKKRQCPVRRSQSISISRSTNSSSDPGSSQPQQQQTQLKEKITHSRDQVKRLIIPRSKIFAVQPPPAVEAAAAVEQPEVAGVALRRMESVRVQIVRSPLIDRLCTLYGMSAGSRRNRR